MLKKKDLEFHRKKTVQHRIRLLMANVDHFVDFVNGPYFYQDVAYGTREIKLGTGEKVAMPNVVRTVTRTTMINQYLQYCEEEAFLPLSTRTLSTILEVREASQRRSLQGLDNIATDGVAAFETLEKVIDELNSLDAESKWCTQSTTTLRGCKRYLKTEYPVDCRDSQQSTRPEQNCNFALGDISGDAFKFECNHVHDAVCSNCESLKNLLREMEDQKKKREHCILHQRSPRRYLVRFCESKTKHPLLESPHS